MVLFLIMRELECLKKNDLSECLFATGGKKYNSIYEIATRKSGCAALDLAYVASGR